MTETTAPSAPIAKTPPPWLTPLLPAALVAIVVGMSLGGAGLAIGVVLLLAGAARTARNKPVHALAGH